MKVFSAHFPCVTNIQSVKTLQSEYSHKTGRRIRKGSVQDSGVYSHSQLHLCDVGRAVLSVVTRRGICAYKEQYLRASQENVYCQLFLPFMW
jgi:hypothetical protein